MTDQTTESQPATRRVIKRYSNRKLYDTKDSRYVTLQQIGEFVRQGQDVQIIDNKTKEDKTEVTLALILSEDLKNQPSSVPLGALRHLIQERGERILSQLRETPVGRFIPPDGQEADVPAVDASAESEEASAEDKSPAKARFEDLKRSVDEFQATIDERVKMLVPGSGSVRQLQSDLAALADRVEALEAAVNSLRDKKSK